MKFQVIVEQDAKGLFVARCPSLPECVAQGTTATEAVARIKEGMTAYLQSLAKQDVMKCDVPGCEIEPVFHCARVESRRILFEKALCEPHAQRFFTEFRSSVPVRGRMQRAMISATAVDLEMIVYYRLRRDTATPACVYLREVAGTRRMCMVVDGWAWFALVTHIKHEPTPRPNTHAAWATTIAELGGELQDVMLDRREGEEWWSAKIAIVKDGGVLRVDVRASDACILALIHDAPIFVAEKALDTFADRGEGASGDWGR